MYPLVHFPLRCRGVAHTNATWELDLGLNGLVSKPLWLYYRYIGDRDFLRQTAWPVLPEGARFNAAYLSEEDDGRLHLVPTVSPEHWGITNHFKRNEEVRILSTLGGPCRLANPWLGREVAVTSEHGKPVAEGTGGHLEFAPLRPAPTA